MRTYMKYKGRSVGHVNSGIPFFMVLLLVISIPIVISSLMANYTLEYWISTIREEKVEIGILPSVGVGIFLPVILPATIITGIYDSVTDEVWEANQ